MNTLISIFKSRTVWSIIVLVAMNVIPAIKDFMPADIFIVIEGVVGLLAIYFRVNAKQVF